jgi:hypothetical protein
MSDTNHKKGLGFPGPFLICGEIMNNEFAIVNGQGLHFDITEEYVYVTYMDGTYPPFFTHVVLPGIPKIEVPTGDWFLGALQGNPLQTPKSW